MVIIFLDKKGLAHYIPLFIGVDVFVGFVGYRLEYNQRKKFLIRIFSRIIKKETKRNFKYNVTPFCC